MNTVPILIHFSSVQRSPVRFSCVPITPAYIVICCIVTFGGSIAVIISVDIVIRRSPRAAHKAAHGGKVDQAAGGIRIGFVLADDAARGAPALVDVIGVDEPLAAGTVGDLAGDIVKAGDAAQVTVGQAVAMAGAAPQRDQQLVDAAGWYKLYYSFYRHRSGYQSPAWP